MSANTHEISGGGMETITAAEATGILGACQILTLKGFVPIETLKAGDRIITRNGMRVLRALDTETRNFRAISVSEGTLGFSRPARPIRLAPDQQVMVRDWRAEILFGRDAVIITADRLIDGKFIASQERATDHTVYHLRFDAEEVIYADGVEVVAPPRADAEILTFAA